MPVRRDFVGCLTDVDIGEASGIRYRIDQARTLREMWHLRSELYSLVALSVDQREAERRLSMLNQHFPTRAPRSGFVPLLP